MHFEGKLSRPDPPGVNRLLLLYFFILGINQNFRQGPQKDFPCICNAFASQPVLCIKFYIHFHHIITITYFHHSSTTIHIHLMVSLNIFKPVGKSLKIFFLVSQGSKPCSIFNSHLYVCVCVCKSVFYLSCIGTSRFSINSQTDLRIMHTQCSNLNFAHGFCGVGQHGVYII